MGKPLEEVSAIAIDQAQWCENGHRDPSAGATNGRVSFGAAG
jgi:hypothetical protein